MVYYALMNTIKPKYLQYFMNVRKVHWRKQLTLLLFPAFHFHLLLFLSPVPFPLPSGYGLCPSLPFPQNRLLRRLAFHELVKVITHKFS